MRRSILLLFSFGVIVAGASAWDRTPTSSPGASATVIGASPVGAGRLGSEGRLRVDVFGSINVEDRPFPVGHTDHSTGEGWLHMDLFRRSSSGRQPV